MTGTGQYTRHLWQTLAAGGAVDVDLLRPGPGDGAVAGSRGAANLARVARPPLPLGDNLTKLWWEQRGFPRGARARSCDLLHYPYFAAPLRPRQPVVSTVHDVIPWIFPVYRRHWSARIYFALVARSILHAAAVITDSEASRRDIVHFLRYPTRRVHVVPLAADPALQPVTDPAALETARQRWGLGKQTVLYLGGLDVRKDVAGLVLAFARVARQVPGVLLALGGHPTSDDPGLFPDVRPLLQSEGIADRVRFLGAVADGDKPALYGLADCFVFPSRYEGFGLPALEAMTCGAPVVCSDSSSLPEVVGEAALLVRPGYPEDLAEAIVRVLQSAELAAELRARGRLQASRFSWERTARETVAVYETVIARARETPGVAGSGQ